LNFRKSIERPFYDLPAIKSRYTSMGKGNRTDFSKIKKNICTNIYNLPSSFNTSNKSGFSFGISRDHYKKVFLQNNTSIDEKTPGPAIYDTRVNLGKDAPKFSFYSKLNNNIINKERSKLTPGPGQYRPISLKSDGKYPLSNIKNTTSIKFVPGKRFNDSKKR